MTSNSVNYFCLTFLMTEFDYILTEFDYILTE